MSRREYEPARPATRGVGRLAVGPDASARLASRRRSTGIAVARWRALSIKRRARKRPRSDVQVNDDREDLSSFSPALRFGRRAPGALHRRRGAHFTRERRSTCVRRPGRDRDAARRRAGSRSDPARRRPRESAATSRPRIPPPSSRTHESNTINNRYNESNFGESCAAIKRYSFPQPSRGTRERRGRIPRKTRARARFARHTVDNRVEKVVDKVVDKKVIERRLFLLRVGTASGINRLMKFAAHRAAGSRS